MAPSSKIKLARFSDYLRIQDGAEVGNREFWKNLTPPQWVIMKQLIAPKATIELVLLALYTIHQILFLLLIALRLIIFDRSKKEWKFPG